MVHIISPQPRLASSAALNTPLQPLPSSSYIPDDPFYVGRLPSLPDVSASQSRQYDASEALLMSPPRLMSPIHLPPDCGPRRSYLSRPATPCSPTKRRRAHPSILSRSRARRHCPRADCCINSIAGGPARFDSLSWISRLQSTPTHTSHWDVADLSLLDVEHPSHSLLGPVRRRKPLRSDPLLAGLCRSDDLGPSMFPLVPHRSDLRTPPPREPFVPSEARFQGVRLVFPPDNDDAWKASENGSH